MTKETFIKQMLTEWNDVVAQFKKSPKQSLLLLSLGFVFALLVTGPMQSNQLSASVTNLGSSSMNEDIRRPKNECATAEVILACQLGTRNCPAECMTKKPDGYGYGQTKKPDGYGYGQTNTDPIVNPVPLCKRAETVLACALGTRNCPEECKTPVNKNEPKPRTIFPPKRR